MKYGRCWNDTDSQEMTHRKSKNMAVQYYQSVFFLFLELDCSTFDVKHLLLHLKSPICSFYSLLQINPR